MGQLDGKVALITGAGKGLGRGIARGLAREGARLVLATRSAADLVTLTAETESLGAEVLTQATDVTQEAQIEALFDATLARFGRLDILVNNAGAFNGGPLHKLATEDWDHVMAVNLRGPFLCTRRAMQIMKLQRGGRIINIGSISAQRVRPGSAPYSASKFGLMGLTHVTALEGRAHGITCCCLHPGNIRTERRHSDRPEDAEPMMTVDEVAQVAVLMATLPPHVELFEAIVLPHEQLYVGRG
jgi:NAD(P)-dependent dehydrogenase (short-subunit alcohol dehydrogenase family)